MAVAVPGIVGQHQTEEEKDLISLGEKTSSNRFGREDLLRSVSEKRPFEKQVEVGTKGVQLVSF